MIITKNKFQEKTFNPEFKDKKVIFYKLKNSNLAKEGEDWNYKVISERPLNKKDRRGQDMFLKTCSLTSRNEEVKEQVFDLKSKTFSQLIYSGDVFVKRIDGIVADVTEEEVVCVHRYDGQFPGLRNAWHVEFDYDGDGALYLERTYVKKSGVDDAVRTLTALFGSDLKLQEYGVERIPVSMTDEFRDWLKIQKEKVFDKFEGYSSEEEFISNCKYWISSKSTEGTVIFCSSRGDWKWFNSDSCDFGVMSKSRNRIKISSILNGDRDLNSLPKATELFPDIINSGDLEGAEKNLKIISDFFKLENFEETKDWVTKEFKAIEGLCAGRILGSVISNSIA